MTYLSDKADLITLALVSNTTLDRTGTIMTTIYNGGQRNVTTTRYPTETNDDTWAQRHFTACLEQWAKDGISS